jgi:hypothetical protein
VPPEADYPFVLDRLCVFAQFAGGRGAITFRVSVVDASTGDEVFGSRTYSVMMPGGHVVVTVLIRLKNCSFPDPGTYLVQLFADGDFVDDRRLTLIRKVHPMSDPFLEKHSNPHTFKVEPVFIFTDDAIVPAKKGPPPEAGNKKDAPPPERPDEEARG